MRELHVTIGVGKGVSVLLCAGEDEAHAVMLSEVL